jgi:O-antigen/teichoic acid export membrane protein
MVIKNIKKRWGQSSTLRNITTVGFGDLISQLINIGIAVILIRGLSVYDYASFSAMSSVANLSSGIIGTGINLALVRFSTEYSSLTGKKAISLYFFVLAIEIIFFILITVISIIFPDQATLLVLGDIDYKIAFQFGLFYGIGLLLTQIGRSIYQAEENFKRFVTVLLLRQGLSLIVIGILLIIHKLTYQNVAVVISVIYIAIGIWIFIKSSEITQFKSFISSFINGKPYFFSFLKASSWLIGYFLLITLIGQVDILTLTRHSTKIELANYSVALKYYSMALVFLGSINSVLLPKFSRIEMQDHNKQKSFTLNWIKYSVWLIIPIGLFDLFGHPLFNLINGTQYVNAFSIFMIFSFGIWLSFSLSPQTNILISRGNYRFLFLVSLIALVFCIIGNSILIPIFGGIGAALVMVATHNLFIQLPILIKVLRD